MGSELEGGSRPPRCGRARMPGTVGCSGLRSPAAFPPPGSVVAAEDNEGCLSVDGE